MQGGGGGGGAVAHLGSWLDLAGELQQRQVAVADDGGQGTYGGPQGQN